MLSHRFLQSCRSGQHRRSTGAGRRIEVTPVLSGVLRRKPEREMIDSMKNILVLRSLRHITHGSLEEGD